MYRIVFIATLFCSWKYCKYCKCDPNDNKTANSLKCYSSVLFFYFNVICSRLIKRTEVIISISGWSLGCSWLQLWGMKGEVIRERNKSRVLPPGVTGSPLKMEMRSSSVTLPCRHSTTWPSCAKEITTYVTDQDFTSSYFHSAAFTASGYKELHHYFARKWQEGTHWFSSSRLGAQ